MVDKFLVENKIEIQDDGFTARVMQSLPERVDWQKRMNRIWNAVCIMVLVWFCWQTDVITNLLIDTKVFFATLPANIQDVSIWQTIGWFYVTIIALTILIFKKYEKVF